MDLIPGLKEEREREGARAVIQAHFDALFPARHNDYATFLQVGLKEAAVEKIFSQFPTKEKCPDAGPEGGIPITCHEVPGMTFMHPCDFTACRCRRPDSQWVCEHILLAMKDF